MSSWSRKTRAQKDHHNKLVSEWRKLHRERVRKTSRAWKDKNLERARELSRKSNRKHRGATSGPIEVQGIGACDICQQEFAVLHFDHDHLTGAHRGWLCGPCNRQLGWYEKQKHKVDKYLEKRKAHQYEIPLEAYRGTGDIIV